MDVCHLCGLLLHDRRVPLVPISAVPLPGAVQLPGSCREDACWLRLLSDGQLVQPGVLWLPIVTEILYALTKSIDIALIFFGYRIMHLVLAK